ncbi:MAG: aromatic-ring-hydroxylating dioxygenase subunit beta [Panacagrimonas sp.]
MSEVTPHLQLSVERFLYEEASLLDRREYRSWLALFTEDLRYRMPARTNHHERAVGAEPAAGDVATFFDETRLTLAQRIKRLESGKAWAEMPPSRTRHCVSNVYLKPADVTGEWIVECCFLLYRSRLERQVDLFVGQRIDRLRPDAGPTRWKIADRLILLDQATLLANNLSIFF